MIRLYVRDGRTVSQILKLLADVYALMGQSGIDSALNALLALEPTDAASTHADKAKLLRSVATAIDEQVRERAHT